MTKIFYCSFEFLTIFLLHGCINNEVNSPGTQLNSISGKDSFSYKTFAEENRGYGFDILLNGKVYIHQPIIPCWQGVQHFITEQDAVSVAAFITNKLRLKNFKFLLQRFEIDSLLPKANYSKLATNPDGHDSNNNINPDNLNNTESHVEKLIPSLADYPIKNKWTVKKNVPFGNRGGGFCFAMGKLVYIGSGENKDEIIKDFWCYNPDKETWTCLAEIPAGCYSGIAFSIFNKGYAGLGTEIGTSSGKFEKHMFEYVPEINSWKKLHDFPGTPRIDPIVFMINNKAYAGSGYDGTNTRDFYEYNAKDDSWKRIPDFAGGDLHASIGIGTGKRGFVVAGSRAPKDFKFVYEYIPSFSKWEQKQDLPGYARQFLCGNLVDSNYIIAGCGGSYEAGIRLRDFYVYNITANAWSRIADYPVESNVGNSRPCGANVDGKAFMGTGYNVDYLHDWNIFEYYFSLRKDTGFYNESVCYPLQYNGKWQTYQECINEDCYIGPQIKTAENLGNFCYSSRLTNDYVTLSLKDNTNKATNKFILLPRWFAMSFDKKPGKEVGLRLFFTREEIDSLANYFEKSIGNKFSLDKIEILQYNKQSNLQPQNNLANLSYYKIVSPHLFSYGFNGQTIVAEFTTATLQSEFYLAINLN